MCKCYLSCIVTEKSSLPDLNMKVLVNLSASVFPASPIRPKHFKGFFFSFSFFNFVFIIPGQETLSGQFSNPAGNIAV